MKLRNLLSGAAIIALSSLPVSAATLLNGGFESPGTFLGPVEMYPAGDTSITGWTIGGAGVDLINEFWEHSEGSYSLDLSALDAGSISQTITDLVPGQEYEVTFDMAGNPFDAPATKFMDVSVGMAFSNTYSFDTTGRSNGDMGWTSYRFSFTAGATSGDLTFASATAGAVGPALDNVAISAVPLPAGLVLLGTGLGALALRRRTKA